MRSPKILLAAALLVSAAPIAAHAAPRHTSHLAARAAWQARREALLKPLHLGPEYLAETKQAAEAGSEDFAVLLKAGDLDGDGADDVVDLRDHLAYDQADDSFLETIRLEAHRGRDGAPLWTITPPAGDYATPMFLPTGANGRAGVLVVSYGGTGVDTPAAGGGQADTTLTSYDGAGKQIWTTSFHGAGAGSMVGYSAGYTDVADVLDAVPGGGTDLLLATESDSFAVDPTWTAEAYATGARYTIVDGATGTQKDLGVPVLAPQGEARAYAVGDLDGDRRQDVVISTQRDDVPTLTAVRSSDGQTLWTMPGTVEDYWRVLPLTDVTGDHKADIAIAQYVSGKEVITLVDGATGRTRWTKPGYKAIVLGNADRKGGDEIAVIDDVDSSSKYGFSAAAYTASGQRLWSVTRTVGMAGVKGGMTNASTGSVGDTDLDGVMELGYEVSISPMGSEARSEGGTVDGRTGRVRIDPVKDLYATIVSLDGHGADAYTRSVEHGLLTFTAWRGDRPAKMWSASVPVKAESPNGSFGTYAERGRAGDVAVSVTDGRTYTSVMFSGRTHGPLWALVRSGNGAAKVTHPAAR